MAEALRLPEGTAAAAPQTAALAGAPTTAEALTSPPAAPAENDNTPLVAEPLVAEATLVCDTMHCGTCMIAIEDALRATPGVASARVNLTMRRVNVSFDTSRVGVDDLIGRLDREGYPAAELIEGREAERQAIEKDLLKRLGVAGFAAANIMLLSVSVWSGSGSDMGHAAQSLFHWVSALIALPAIAYSGQPFFQSAFRTLRARRLNMDVPITLGVVLATAMSLAQTMKGSHQVYFDAAITLLFFLLIGRVLDARMRARAAGAAANLLGLKATTATVIRADGTNARVSSRQLKPGDRILVAAGERIPADACVVSGESEVEESLITGESVPRRIAASAQIFAGTINGSGAILVEATATDQNTVLAEISRLLENAEQGRGKYVQLADRAARIYAPAVHILGLSTFVGWMALGSGWEPALMAAIAVLIITCPCALALAVPAVQVAATSRLFAQGVIVKSGDALERLSEIDTVVLDKTGTLSLGEPRLVAGAALPAGALAMAARLALASRHPYSRAIVRAAAAAGLDVTPADGVVEVSGNGLEWSGPSGVTRLGRAAFCGIAETTGQDATLYLAEPGRAPVAFVFEDALRPDAAETIAAFKAAGLAVELLSGDREAAVAQAARATGLTTWRAGVSPAGKIARIEELKASGRKVLMIGDGLNDAPALAAGHASVSPATAADISQTAADAIFQGARLAPIVEAIAVGRAAQRMAKENFAIALGYNVIFVPMAVAGFVTPLVAAIAMSASSIAVVANAIRLRGRRVRL